MTQFRSSAKVFVVAAVAAFALTALVAASASAAILPAKFSGSSLKLTTSGVTIKKNGAEAKTCTLAATTTGTMEKEKSWYLVGNQPFGETRFNCPFYFLDTLLYGEAKYDSVSGGYYLNVANSGAQLYSAWGNYYVPAGGFTGTWTNGSGGTPSTLSFSETLIGTTTSGGNKITMTGSFNVTTPTGGLITLSH